MPLVSAGSSRGQLILVLLALTMPSCVMLVLRHPTYGPRLKTSFSELTSEDDVYGEPSALSALKEMNFSLVARQMQNQWESWNSTEPDLPGRGNEEPQSLNDQIAQGIEPSSHPVASAAFNPPPIPQSPFRTLVQFPANSMSVTASKPALPDLGGRPPILKTTTTDRIYYGIPIGSFRDESWIIQNDGVIQLLPRETIISEEVIPEPFQPIGLGQLVVDLRKEFGHDYHVQADKPFVFVSRKGASQYWNERFKLLHSAMGQFCRTRGIAMRGIEFPLVAIIFRSQAEFYQYGRIHDLNIPENCLGIYSQKSNRILLYEDANLLSRQETIENICHEATHQLAWNLGLHQRFAHTPLWLSEGLATLFEAPAYSQPNSAGKSPWPNIRRDTWAQLLKNPQVVNAALDSMIRNDNFFEQDPDTAYAVAWGLTHFLANSQPKQFNTYLEQVRKLPPFVPFDARSRWEHFRSHFGEDTGKLSIALRNHIISLR